MNYQGFSHYGSERDLSRGEAEGASSPSRQILEHHLLHHHVVHLSVLQHHHVHEICNGYDVIVSIVIVYVIIIIIIIAMTASAS
jgi:hypothetical protein